MLALTAMACSLDVRVLHRQQQRFEAMACSLDVRVLHRQQQQFEIGKGCRGRVGLAPSVTSFSCPTLVSGEQRCTTGAVSSMRDADSRKDVLDTPISRRLALLIAVGIPASPAFADGQDPPVGNAVLRSLGIGDPDIYYPRFFEGVWDCFSTLLSVDTPQGDDKVDLKSVNFSRKQIGYTVVYKARFIPYESNIIGDRLFTTKSLVESTVGQDVITSGNWSPKQPNRLSLELRGGTKVENLVTKRSAGMSAPGQFDTSEYSKQVFDTKRGGPPSVKASRNLTRYRWDPTEQNVSAIEAVQRVAMYPVPGSEVDTMDIFSMANPVTIYRYIVQFRRSS